MKPVLIHRDISPDAFRNSSENLPRSLWEKNNISRKGTKQQRETEKMLLLLLERRDANIRVITLF